MRRSLTHQRPNFISGDARLPESRLAIPIGPYGAPIASRDPPAAPSALDHGDLLPPGGATRSRARGSEDLGARRSFRLGRSPFLAVAHKTQSSDAAARLGEPIRDPVIADRGGAGSD